MKRLSTLFLALICSAAVLTSCNNEPADQTATSKPAKSDPAASNGNQETRNYEPAFTEEERAARIARKEAIAREAEENRQNNPVLKEEYNLNSTYRYIDTAPEFSMFAKLIRASDMAKQMHGTQITLFAADDEAFAKVDQGMLHKLTDPDNKKALNDFIRASMCTHVVDEKSILTANEPKDFNGKKLNITNKGGVQVNGCKVTGKAIITRNGQILRVETPIGFPESL